MGKIKRTGERAEIVGDKRLGEEKQTFIDFTPESVVDQEQKRNWSVKHTLAVQD